MRLEKVRRGHHLPQYDPKARCPKCGGPEVRTDYRNEGCSDPSCTTCEAEHLRRACCRCHYVWAEAALDKWQLLDAHLDGADDRLES